MNESDSQSPSESESESSSDRRGPTRLHKTLGVLTLVIFLLLVSIDMLPGYTVRPSLGALLAITYLTLLGFGHVAGDLLNLYGGDGKGGGGGGN